MDGTKKLEEAATSILTRAVVLDKANRYTEALVCYQEGLQLLFEVRKGLPEGRKKDALKVKMEEYMGRAEHIKKVVNEKKELGTYHEELTIEDDSKGHGYESIIGRFLGPDIESVKIEDPHIRVYHQYCNLVQFCELVVKKCKHLKRVELITKHDSENSTAQMDWFNTLQTDLRENYNINMEFEFSDTLHDRMILFSNGWVIKIGRGLDYFKRPITANGLGRFDTDFRPCRKTKVDIYHDKTLKST